MFAAERLLQKVSAAYANVLEGHRRYIVQSSQLLGGAGIDHVDSDVVNSSQTAGCAATQPTPVLDEAIDELVQRLGFDPLMDNELRTL
jgi:hypothetical protein